MYDGIGQATARPTLRCMTTTMMITVPKLMFVTMMCMAMWMTRMKADAVSRSTEERTGARA